MSLYSFVHRVYEIDLNKYSLGLCHLYPDIPGRYSKEVNNILPYVKRNEIINAVGHFLNKNYRHDYDIAFYNRLKNCVETKIRSDFKKAQNIIHSQPYYILIDFESDTIEFEHTLGLQKYIMSIINKAYGTNHTWEDYCGDWLKVISEKESPIIAKEYKATEETVLIKLLSYLGDWEKYFSTEEGNLFKFDISSINVKVKERYSVEEVVEYLRKTSINAHAGTRHYGHRIQSILNVARRERETMLKKQRAKERRKYLRELHKKNKNI